jgi:hypothetical protein
MARTALLGALVVLANALSAYFVVRTRGERQVRVVRLGRPVVAIGPAPKQRWRKRGSPRRMP